MGFTPAQQTALDIGGRDVLVSAAAASGKTFTLTQRIIKNILEKNADISRILGLYRYFLFGRYLA